MRRRGRLRARRASGSGNGRTSQARRRHRHPQGLHRAAGTPPATPSTIFSRPFGAGWSSVLLLRMVKPPGPSSCSRCSIWEMMMSSPFSRTKKMINPTQSTCVPCLWLQIWQMMGSSLQP